MPCDDPGVAGRVVIAGSINADLVVRTARLPAPGETVLGRAVDWHPGGKSANQAAAASLAGAAVTFIGCLGRDEHGPRLRAALEATGVRVVVRPVDYPSGQAIVTVDEHGDNTVVVVPGANGALTADDVIDEAASLGPNDVAVACLEAPTDAVLAFLEAAAPARRILNPTPVERCAPELLAAADIVVVNEHEQRVLRLDRAPLVVTEGSRGAVVDGVRIDAPKVIAVDTTGAGDCFVGTLAARLAAGDDLVTSARAAVVAASRSTSRPGAMSSYQPDR